MSGTEDLLRLQAERDTARNRVTALEKNGAELLARAERAEAEVERLRKDNAWLDRHYRQATEADEAVHEKVSDALGLDEGISWDALVDKIRQMREDAS